MKDLSALNRYRIPLHGLMGDETCGSFVLPHNGIKLHVIASSDLGWDHVSVSLERRCPTWLEMEHVKRLFFQDDETVMQLHVPTLKHISVHPYCLHLWRPHVSEIPLPPPWMVA